LRAIERGWRVRYRGDIVVDHKLSAERRVGWSEVRWFRFVRNRLYIERKWDVSRLSLVPRMAGYLVKGARNGHMVPTLRAIFAASATSLEHVPRPRSRATHDYLQRNDLAYRGPIWRRLHQEILGVLPDQRRTVRP
jgi:hypothetical protein